MNNYFSAGLLILVVLTHTANISSAVERARFATHVRTSPQYVLPPLAALEKGFWKEEGLEVTWVPFDLAPAMHHAVAAGAVDVGSDGLATMVQAISSGVPQMMVADPGITTEFIFWVLNESRLKEPKDLKGAKIGITRFRGELHIYSQAALKALGLEKDVRFVAMGGVTALIAGLKARASEVAVASIFPMASLKLKGEVRELLKLDDYIPKGLQSQVIYAQRDFLRKKSELVRKVVRGFLQGANFVMKNPEWAVEKLKTELRQTEAGARAIYPLLRYDTEGKIDVKKIENVINFLMEYGLMPKEKRPPLESLYTREIMG